jgi:hypothetical protein
MICRPRILAGIQIVSILLLVKIKDNLVSTFQQNPHYVSVENDNCSNNKRHGVGQWGPTITTTLNRIVVDKNSDQVLPWTRVPRVMKRPSSSSGSSPTRLDMFMGSDGGILGIGGPELVSEICNL